MCTCIQISLFSLLRTQHSQVTTLDIRQELPAQKARILGASLKYKFLATGDRQERGDLKFLAGCAADAGPISRRVEACSARCAPAAGHTRSLDTTPRTHSQVRLADRIPQALHRREVLFVKREIPQRPHRSRRRRLHLPAASQSHKRRDAARLRDRRLDVGGARPLRRCPTSFSTLAPASTLASRRASCSTSLLLEHLECSH